MAPPVPFLGKHAPRTQMALVRCAQQMAAYVAASFGGALVWRPGAATGGNVYGTWAALVTAAQGVQGLKTVYCDDALGACVIPSGNWDLGGYTVLQGRQAGQGPTGMCEVVIADGARLINVFEFNMLIVETQSASPVMRTSDYAGTAPVVFRLGMGTLLTASGAADFMVVDGGPNAANWWLTEDSRFVQGAMPILRAGSHSAVADVWIADTSVVEARTVAANPNAHVNVHQASVEALYDFDQNGGVGVTPLGIRIAEGTGSPDGVVYGMQGDMYVDRTGGTKTLWVKEVGNGNVNGWVSK